MDSEDRTVESRIAWLASRAHGIVTRGELLEASVTPTQIKRRVKRGDLIRVHRAVFRVGHQAPGVETRYHGTRHAWEQDHEREREARERGDEFRPYTWRDLVEDPEAMIRDVGELLGTPAIAPPQH